MPRGRPRNPAEAASDFFRMLRMRLLAAASASASGRLWNSTTAATRATTSSSGGLSAITASTALRGYCEASWLR